MKRKTFLKSLLGLPILFSFKTESVKKNKVVIFTPELISKNDIGLYIIKDKVDVFKNPSYAATVAFKISWTLGVYVNELKGEKMRNEYPKYGLTNFLTDGRYCPIGNTYQDICDYLNNNPYGEKYRIMTKEELFYIIENRNNSKQLFYE